ncbi:MAG TPA: YidC/Oxa1 family membrane protein insertase [Gammaproteobacteria bacterium]|nr:YidC/Oxa1 family membrane protein insertase [Gammaproteobacteria bacterium]
MDIWSAWLDSISSIVMALAADAGLGLGLAVIVATVLLRIVLLPVAWPMAYRACIRQKKLAKLQPELRALQRRFRDEPEVYLRKMTELYKANQLAMVDARTLLGSLAQLPLFLGMFQVLRNTGDGVRFLWIPNLLRPDIALAVIAGITTWLMMAVNPDLPEQVRIIMIVVPSIIAVVAALQFSSALAIYWATSNTFSALQTVALHAVVRRRIRAGLVRV